jgi:molecular chaperone DnaK
MNATRAVGIDLGTTNSVVACLDETGRTQVVRNAEGELVTPSVVFFDKTEIVVGRPARQAARVDASRVAACVKRDMGQPHYSHLINGQHLPPEVIQACILRKLRRDTEAAIGPNFKTVITVPAYFDEPRRKATSDAGEMAGLDVLDIVNEPTAAALAFSEQSGYLTDAGQPREPIKVLVYDLGGGTFDVTLIDLVPGNITTLATDGDVQLGGRDWDELLADHAAAAFVAQLGIDPRQDQTSVSRLMALVEEAKHTLTSRGRSVIHVEHAGRSVEVPITLRQFEQLSEALLERTAFTTRQLLSHAGVAWGDVSRVLLVGGSTRMPMVAAMLQRLSGVPADRSINPDEAVARGAALFAWYQMQKQGDAGGGTFQVTDVNAHSLGIQAIDQQTRQRENIIVIPRNTPLPVKVTRPFVTQTINQKSIVVQVLEGESRQPTLCSPIGRTVLRDLPADLPQGYPVHITFAYGSNSRLHVEAGLAGTDRKVAIALERERGLSGELVHRWRQLFDDQQGETDVDALLAEALQTPGVPTAARPVNTSTGASASAAVGVTPGAQPLAKTAAWTGKPPGGTASLQPRAAAAPLASPVASPSSAQSASATVTHADDQPGAPKAEETLAPDSTPAAGDGGPGWAWWTILIGGICAAAAVGFALTYLMLCWLSPAVDIFGIFSP